MWSFGVCRYSMRSIIWVFIVIIRRLPVLAEQHSLIWQCNKPCKQGNLDFIFVHGRLIDLWFTTRNKMIRHSNETGVITRSLASSNLEIHDIISLTETRPIQLSLTRTLFATGTSEIMDLVQRFRQIVARPRATALRLAPFVPLSFHPFPRPLVLPKPEAWGRNSLWITHTKYFILFYDLAGWCRALFRSPPSHGPAEPPQARMVS